MLRSAQPDESADFAALVKMSDHTFLPFLFSGRLESILRRMFPQPRNLFSYEHVRVIELEGRVAGMLLGYSFEQMRREMTNTGWLWLRYAGFYLLWRMPRFALRLLSQSNRRAPSANWLNEGEFYVSNMAVKPEFRRRGLGHRLLDDAIARAKELGCRRIALDVESDNVEAVRLYERAGLLREESNLQVMGRFEFLRLSREL